LPLAAKSIGIKQNHPAGCQHSYFCELNNQWVKKLDVCLRLYHRAGEKAFNDYAGQTVPIVDPDSGALQYDAQLFIALLGASNYTFAEAGASQSLQVWIASHIRAFKFFNGVSQIFILSPLTVYYARSEYCRDGLIAVLDFTKTFYKTDGKVGQKNLLTIM
jgi:hypothetical protein